MWLQLSEESLKRNLSKSGLKIISKQKTESSQTMMYTENVYIRNSS